jgi:2-polyprenyl-3-methyl-5-hydroxy-6-metoxy-1,4-benzoquinol methylase
MTRLLKSCLCTQAQIESASFQLWSEKLRPAWDTLRSGLKILHHRKLWEWCYIAQALWERGLMRPGRRGLGFGVGREPLAALFASHGCEIVATDLPEAKARKDGWLATHQHAGRIEALNEHGLCPPDAFRRRVRFREANMNTIAKDLRDFDFVWSSCAFEHLGSIDHGQRFIYNSMDCLKPSGIGVHTTEYNSSSNTQTIDHAQTVLYRERDIKAITGRLRNLGHRIELDLSAGDGFLDKYIDLPPYKPNPHLKFQFGLFVTTSIGLIIEKTKEPSQRRWLSMVPRPALVHWPVVATRALLQTAKRAGKSLLIDRMRADELFDS